MRSHYHRLMYKVNRWRVERKFSALFWDPQDVEDHNKRVAQEFGWQE